MRNIFSILICSIFVIVLGQEEVDFLPKITPPSPDAAALGDYGNIPVGEFTGAASISIPLLNFKTKNLEMPISMYYGSNGIRVDEFGSNVGLGWNINIGGVITRTVRDMDDFEFPRLYGPEDSSGGMTNPLLMEFFQKGAYDDVDTEADVFSFKAGNYSGEFVFGEHGIVFLSPQKVKVTVLYDESHTPYFELITPDGIKYIYKEREKNIFRTRGAGHQPPSLPIITAWYLTKIIHPMGDEIYLTYSSNGKNYINSQSQTLSYSFPSVQTTYEQIEPEVYIPIYYMKPPTLGPILSHNIKVQGKKIETIYSNNIQNGRIELEYIYNSDDKPTLLSRISLLKEDNSKLEDIQFQYTETENNRFFLESFQFKNSDKAYLFEYINPETFPERLSKSQDHWGYYNGKVNNQNIVPKNLPEVYPVHNVDYDGADRTPDGMFAKIGMLNKIYYPTKGYTEIEYEDNTYWGEVILDGTKTIEYLEVNTEFSQHDDDSFILESPQDQTVTVYGSASFMYYSNDCTENLGPSKHKIILNVKELDTNDSVPLFIYDQWGGKYTLTVVEFKEGQVHNPVYFDAKENKKYEVKITAHRECTEGNVGVHFFNESTTINYENISTGGIRLKSTKDVSLITNNEIYKRYYYGKLSTLNQSSGDLGASPNYIDIHKITTPMLDHLIYDQVVSSSSLISLFDTGKSNIYYPFVTISFGGDNFENGGIAKEFILSRDYWGNNLFGENIKSAPWTNFGWNNGYEKKSKILKRDPNGGTPIVVEEAENFYTNDERDDAEQISYTIREDYPLGYYGEVTHLCTAEDADKEFLFKIKVCTTEHSHSWFISIGFSEGYKCIASGANNIYLKFPNPCWQKEGDTIIRSNLIQNLSVMQYKNISHWNYLSKSKTTTYDSDGNSPIQITTDYYYDNPEHLQITSKTTTDSNGKILETAFYYPPDLIGIEQSPYMQQLTDANRIAEPVITKTTKGDKHYFEKHLKYGNNANTGNLLLPTELHTKKGMSSININSVNDRKLTYTKYDTTGNLLEYQTENGLYVSIIWGYNNQYPIAKIEGVAFDNLPMQVVSTILNLSDSGQLSHESFYELINTVDGMVTGYTYEPLVGVKTITQPNGITGFYEYDSFGRLVSVKDTDGNVLKEIEYNFKQ